MSERDLTGAEQALARQVFKNTLFFGRIQISDDLGLGDAPWTSVGLWTYTLNIGPKGYKDALQDQDTKAIFIHELTHAWQGQNSIIGFGYIINSALHQCKAIITNPNMSPLKSRAAVYRYLIGKDWDDYNCEQQATIVEHWFCDGMKEVDTDPRFKYIRDYIRKGKA